MVFRIIYSLESLGDDDLSIKLVFVGRIRILMQSALRECGFAHFPIYVYEFKEFLRKVYKDGEYILINCLKLVLNTN